jgi:hypothetical protein
LGNAKSNAKTDDKNYENFIYTHIFLCKAALLTRKLLINSHLYFHNALAGIESVGETSGEFVCVVSTKSVAAPSV